MTTYNGWTNYETWNIALWLNNDSPEITNAAKLEAQQDKEALRLFTAYIYDPATPDGVHVEDEAINWDEIHQAFLES